MRFKIIVLIALIVALVPFARSNAQGQSAPTPGQVRLTFSDLGNDDMTLQGPTPNTSLWIPFEPGWLIPKAELEIHYIASPVLSNSRSTLTVTADGVALTSIKPQTDNAEHSFQVSIPPRFLTDVGIDLGFSTFATLPDSTCLDTRNPALWMTITNDSSITLHPALNTKPPKLSDLSTALIGQNSYGKPSPLLLVLPDKPDVTTLTTASQVAARLGATTGSALPLQAVTASAAKQEQLANSDVVLIGIRDSLPILNSLTLPAPAVKGGFTTDQGTAIPADQAVIQILNSPWSQGRKVLLVSAGSVKGLQLAGQAFADKVTAQTLKNPVEAIQALVPTTNASPQSVWDAPSITFAQLGQGTEELQGIGSFNKFFGFRYPPGWQLTAGSQLDLKVAFSPVMNPDASYVTGFINDQPIGSLRTGQGVDATDLTVALPLDALNNESATQQIQLHLSVANVLKTELCQDENPTSAWTSILGESTLTLSHTYAKVPDLLVFPYPFVSDKADAPTTTIILPAQPSADDLTAGLEVATTLGRFAPANFGLQMVTYSDTLKDTQANSQLIILGTPDRQPLVGDFAGKMFTDIKSSADALKETQGANTGAWLEGVSPWNKDRIALLVSGTSGPAFVQTAALLAHSDPPITTAGLIALVDSSGSANTILKQPPTPTPTATVAPTQAATQAATSAATPSK